MTYVNIYLDDIRYPSDTSGLWTVCRSVEEAKEAIAVTALAGNRIGLISLDHDLGENQPTGYDFVCWMEAYNAWPDERPTVHSMNPVGRRNMERAITHHYGDK